jgi:WD40 repeat protein
MISKPRATALVFVIGLSLALAPAGYCLKKDPPKRKGPLPKGEQVVEPFMNLKGESGGVNSVTFSPDGKYVAASCNNGKSNVWVWLTKGGEYWADFPIYRFGVAQVAFSPDSAYFAASGFGDPPRVWELKPFWNLWRELPIGSGTVTFYPDSKTLATTDGKLALWDLKGNKSKGTLGKADKIFSIAPSSDFSVLAVGDRDGKITVLDAKTGETKKAWEAHEGVVQGLVFMADGKSLVSFGKDCWVSPERDFCKVQIWNPTDGELTKSLKIPYRFVHKVHALAVIPKTNMLLVAGNWNWIHVFDLDTDKEIMTLVGGAGIVRAIAVSADGRLVAGGCGNTVQLWKLPERKQKDEKPYDIVAAAN